MKERILLIFSHFGQGNHIANHPEKWFYEENLSMEWGKPQQVE
jgi:hypothetical protein